jgi:hypothetical protein
MPYKNPADRDTYPASDQKPAVKKARAARNKARAMLEREGKVHKGDGKDVDHKKPLSKGGTTSKGNLRVKSASSNRSFPRNPDHTIKGK